MKKKCEVVAEEDGVVCGRKACELTDTECLNNKTKTVAWQFLPLPSVDFIVAPLTLLNIRTVGYSVYPRLTLTIIGGNEEGLFDTIVTGDRAALRLLKPLKGPTEKEIVLLLENKDFRGEKVISRHITHAGILVGGTPYSEQ